MNKDVLFVFYPELIDWKYRILVYPDSPECHHQGCERALKIQGETLGVVVLTLVCPPPTPEPSEHISELKRTKTTCL